MLLIQISLVLLALAVLCLSVSIILLNKRLSKHISSSCLRVDDVLCANCLQSFVDSKNRVGSSLVSKIESFKD